MQIAVAGATGFIGSALVPELEAAGHDVAALSRGNGVDVTDPGSLGPALEGQEVLIYLVHSLADKDFREIDAQAAHTAVQCAQAAGLGQIIYLSGLGDDEDDLSEHLRSRHEVETILESGEVPVTVLRAGIVLGKGGASWEILRQLVQRLPVMITPRWVRTKSQPVALADLVRWLVEVVGLEAAKGRRFDVGGPEVMTYEEMMHRLAKVRNRPLLVAPVPLLSPGLSSRWLKLITDVDANTAQSLVGSMTNEVVVRDGDALQELLPHDRLTFEEAARAALAGR